jgi:hypothetical protein
MTGDQLRERIDALGLFPRQPSGELGVNNATKAGNLLGVGRTTLLGYLRGAFPVPARVAQQVECLDILYGILERRSVSASDLKRIADIFQPALDEGEPP